jgi:hypothetical protein
VRATAERRADGVYVAAGVELIEPESLHQSALAPGGVWVTPSQVARLGDKLGWETAKRLREATGHRDCYQASYTRRPVLKACRCSAIFVGDSCTRHCPACKREANLLATRTAVRRFRAKRRPQPPLALQCRQCDAPMTLAGFWDRSGRGQGVDVDVSRMVAALACGDHRSHAVLAHVGQTHRRPKPTSA